MSEIEFINGLMVKAPHERAPDFVKATISIKREELIAWLQGKNDEWINLQVKESRGGKWYAAVDDWKPNQCGQQQQAPAQNNEFSDDIPF